MIDIHSMRALFLTFGLTLATVAAAQFTPAIPIEQQPVRFHLDALVDPIDPAQTTIAKVDGRITVTIIPATSTTSAPVSALDVTLGSFPSGFYPLDVIERVISGDGEIDSTVFTITFDVLPRGTTPPQPIEDYSDLWWDPDEPGWGLQVTQHPGGNLFATLLVYAQDGSATWYVMMGGAWSDTVTYSGPFYKTHGPWFGMPIAAGFDIQQVGTATFAFTGYSTMAFTYSVDGVSKMRNLQRQPF